MATIVVGVTGGVAAFKAPIVVRECQRAGHACMWQRRAPPWSSWVVQLGRGSRLAPSLSKLRGKGVPSTWSLPVWPT